MVNLFLETHPPRQDWHIQFHQDGKSRQTSDPHSPRLPNLNWELLTRQTLRSTNSGQWLPVLSSAVLLLPLLLCKRTNITAGAEECGRLDAHLAQWGTNDNFMQGFLCISKTITLNSLDPPPGS